MKNILVAIDHTKAAATAQALAIDLASRHYAHLTGIGILDEAAISSPEPVPLGATGYKMVRDHELLARERQLLAQSLAEFSDRCRTANIEPQLRLLEGHQLEQLEREATRHDLVIMGRDTKYSPISSNESKVSKTVERMLKDNPRPVIVTPAEPLGGENLLIIYDGRPCSDRLLQVLTMLGLHRDWPVEIMGVGDHPDQAEAHARRAGEYLEQYDVSAAIHLAPIQSHIEDSILDAAHSCHARLVAASSAPQHGWRRLFHGSVEANLLKKSPVAVFVYH